MEIEALNDERGMRIVVSGTHVEMALIGKQAIQNAVDLLAKGLADKFLVEKGNDLIAQIPLSAVTNRVVAEAVTKIGSTTVEKK